MKFLVLWFRTFVYRRSRLIFAFRPHSALRPRVTVWIGLGGLLVFPTRAVTVRLLSLARSRRVWRRRLGPWQRTATTPSGYAPICRNATLAGSLLPFARSVTVVTVLYGLSNIRCSLIRTRPRSRRMTAVRLRRTSMRPTTLRWYVGGAFSLLGQQGEALIRDNGAALQILGGDANPLGQGIRVNSTKVREAAVRRRVHRSSRDNLLTHSLVRCSLCLVFRSDDDDSTCERVSWAARRMRSRSMVLRCRSTSTRSSSLRRLVLL